MKFSCSKAETFTYPATAGVVFDLYHQGAAACDSTKQWMYQLRHIDLIDTGTSWMFYGRLIVAGISLKG
jgi:hypothetical protein